MTEQSKSWRDVIKVHPAADLFPMMTPDELKALAEDISKHDVLIPVTLWGPDAILLDGRNRLEALALAGFSAVDETSRRLSDHVRFRRLNEDVDPYEYVISANLHRRHLTTQQKLELLDKVMKANPTISSRRVAKLVGASPTTATKRRHKLEAKGDVSTVDTSIDTKGRAQPTHKPAKKKRRDIEDYIAEKKARTAAQAADKPADAPAAKPELSPNDVKAAEEAAAQFLYRLEDLAEELNQITCEMAALGQRLCASLDMREDEAFADFMDRHDPEHRNRTSDKPQCLIAAIACRLLCSGRDDLHAAIKDLDYVLAGVLEKRSTLAPSWSRPVIEANGSR